MSIGHRFGGSQGDRQFPGIVRPSELRQESAAMEGVQDETERAEPQAAATEPKAGPSRPARIVSAPVAAPAALTVEAIALPPPVATVSLADLLALGIAFSLHVILILAILERSSRIGGGGSDLEAMGVEIVMVSPALESRSLDGVRDRAMAGRVVGPDDGALPAEARTAAADRRPIEDSRSSERPASETAAAPADLVVREWVEPTPPDKSPASEPVIARARSEGEQQAALREATSEETAREPVPPAPAQRPSSPEDPMAAALPGGFAARGRDVIDGASAVMAAARAGRKDKFGTEVYAALRASVPRPVPGVVGKVTVEFVVSPIGGVLSSRIRATTGSRVLEEAALAAVRSARFPRPPPELTPADLVYSMEYTFR